MRSLRSFLLALATVFAIPSIAHADLRLGGDGTKVERKGLLVGLSLAPGMARAGNTFAPAMRFRFTLGGGVHEAVTIATELGIHKPVGINAKKIGFDVDVVATGYLGRFFVRGGVGASSWAYAAARDPYRPGIGGLVGIGWEFPMGKTVGLGLGVDYDVRVRSDRLMAQTVLFGLRLNAYPKK
jgi:hypothetical protein